MNYCPICGKPVAHGHRFCPNCGVSLELKAPLARPTPPRGATNAVGEEEASLAERLGRVVGRHRVLSMIVAGIGLAALALVVVVAFLGGQRGCYRTAVGYGDLARRVDYANIDAVRDQVDVEVENDDVRLAAQLTLNFVSSAKILGGEAYPSRSELESFVRSSACVTRE